MRTRTEWWTSTTDQGRSLLDSSDSLADNGADSLAGAFTGLLGDHRNIEYLL
ncbi:hypothetical protein [Rhodococcus sp. 06-156-3C]|uniref:hypothetical protein n=1 Tax=Rhodococcus sp. 06-156-3C TaxID=2022486 RepID=UPI000A92D513|nr:MULTISPECIES: hypothetical protein [unclassified Rhodococcus (in: high G+C Gram-positive bacteria)]